MVGMQRITYFENNGDQNLGSRRRTHFYSSNKKKRKKSSNRSVSFKENISPRKKAVQEVQLEPQLKNRSRLLKEAQVQKFYKTLPKRLHSTLRKNPY